MTVIAIPKILNDRLTDDGARALVDILNTVENSTQKATLEIAEERFERKLADTKAELIKWMFIFWIGQFASIVGALTAILFAFFKH